MSYDPSVGRWTQEDPIAFGGGDANLYRYVGNTPTNFTDPSGLAAKPTDRTGEFKDVAGENGVPQKMHRSDDRSRK